MFWDAMYYYSVYRYTCTVLRFMSFPHVGGVIFYPKTQKKNNGFLLCFDFFVRQIWGNIFRFYFSLWFSFVFVHSFFFLCTQGNLIYAKLWCLPIEMEIWQRKTTRGFRLGILDKGKMEWDGLNNLYFVLLALLSIYVYQLIKGQVLLGWWLRIRSSRLARLNFKNIDGMIRRKQMANLYLDC